MSLSLAEPPVRAPESAPAGWRRWLRLPGRLPVHTVFVQADGAVAYAGGGAVQRQPASPAWLPAFAGGDVRVVLSGLLTHQLVVTDPALPLEDVDSLLAWARHQFVHYHGAAAERWALAPWLTRSQRGATAAHGIDLDALQHEASAQAVRLRAVHPWWAVALQAAALQSPGLAQADRAELWIVEGVHLTRVGCAEGRIVQIEQHWLEQATPDALASLRAELAPQGAPLLLGYGIEGVAPPAGFELLGALSGEHPAPRWLGC